MKRVRGCSVTQDWVGTHIAGQGRCPCPGECDDSLQSHQTRPPTVHPTSRRQNNRRTAQATNVGCGGAGTTYFPYSRTRNRDSPSRGLLHASSTATVPTP